MMILNCTFLSAIFVDALLNQETKIDGSRKAVKVESPMVGLKADSQTPSGPRRHGRTRGRFPRRLAGTNNPAKKWPRGVVTYTLGYGMTPWIKSRIRQGMQQMQAKVPCISFQESPNGEVKFQATENGCFSALGKVTPQDTAIGHRQVLNLMRTQSNTVRMGCNPMHTIKHEIMHTLGAFHTQTRSDRDQHIHVDTSVLEDPQMEGQFTKVTSQNASNYQLPYDFDSIMHYPSHGFARRGQQTIKGKTADTHARINRERGNDMSPGDIELLKRMYGCSATGGTGTGTGTGQPGGPNPGQPNTGGPNPGQPNTGRPNPGQPNTGRPNPGQPNTGRPNPVGPGLPNPGGPSPVGPGQPGPGPSGGGGCSGQDNPMFHCNFSIVQGNSRSFCAISPYRENCTARCCELNSR